jgi:hypothetical protein
MSTKIRQFWALAIMQAAVCLQAREIAANIATASVGYLLLNLNWEKVR